MEKITDIGGIGNYCGGLQVKSDGDKFYWRVEDTCDTDNIGWEEIDQRLYDELMAWEERRGK